MVEHPYQFSFESYGVRIGVDASDAGLMEQLVELITRILPNGYDPIEHDRADHRFRFELDAAGNCSMEIVLSGQEPIWYGEAGDRTVEDVLDLFYNQLHLTIGLYAESHVFLHAAVVAWRGKGILLPGHALTGKTTLVQELLKLGAQYYSDEYAPVDHEGLVHPFAKMLSIRGIVDEHTQTEVTPDSLGAVTGEVPVPVGLVVLTEYAEGAGWSPETLGAGDAIMEMVRNTVPMRQNPAMSLKVLNRIANDAVVIRSKRGDAAKIAPEIINFLEKIAY